MNDSGPVIACSSISRSVVTVNDNSCSFGPAVVAINDDSCSSDSVVTCSSTSGSTAAATNDDSCSPDPVDACPSDSIDSTGSDESFSEDHPFTASFFRTDCIHPLIVTEEISPATVTDQYNASNKDETSDDDSSQSVSEECPNESSDTKFFNITFSLSGKDFRFYFPGNYKSDLFKKVYTIIIPNGIKKIEDRTFMDFITLTNITIPNKLK